MCLVRLFAAALCLALVPAAPSMTLAGEPQEANTEASASEQGQPAPRDVAMASRPASGFPLPLMKQIQRQVTRDLQRRIDADAKLLVEDLTEE